MEKIVCNNNCKLTDFIKQNYSLVSFSAIQKLLRNKDIKVNGKRVKENIQLYIGDNIEIYFTESNYPSIQVLYKDDNIVVVNKPRGIVVCETGSNNTLQTILEKQLNCNVYPVHRLDFSTAGLTVFALNKIAEAELLLAFKNHSIKKYYKALVVGVPKEKHKVLTAYLKKDANKSMVYISNNLKPGYDKIITEYWLESTNQITSILNVQLHTGKTHQIRAHLASIGLPIVGDNKYGDKQFNKQSKKTKQQLTACKLDLGGLDKLSYLNGKVIELSVIQF